MRRLGKMMRPVVLSLALLSTSTFGFTIQNTSTRTRTSVRTLKKESSSELKMGLLDFLGLGGGGAGKSFDYPCGIGDESIMSPKAHGTSSIPVQDNLRWDCDQKVADNICNFNRHYAEYRGYWQSTEFLKASKAEYEANGEIKFHDSNTGKLLFIAPKGRSYDEFIKESISHGWPSFRDEEVVWDDFRCLKNGEAVSLDGTHLGHNIPDFSGNRYCINLVSVAGNPEE